MGAVSRILNGRLSCDLSLANEHPVSQLDPPLLVQAPFLQPAQQRRARLPPGFKSGFIKKKRDVKAATSIFVSVSTTRGQTQVQPGPSLIVADIPSTADAADVFTASASLHPSDGFGSFWALALLQTQTQCVLWNIYCLRFRKQRPHTLSRLLCWLFINVTVIFISVQWIKIICMRFPSRMKDFLVRVSAWLLSARFCWCTQTFWFIFLQLPKRQINWSSAGVETLHSWRNELWMKHKTWGGLPSSGRGCDSVGGLTLGLTGVFMSVLSS